MPHVVCIPKCVRPVARIAGRAPGSFYGLRIQAPMIGFSIAGKNFPNKVLARQQAKLLRSPFQTGVRDGISTPGVQGE